MTTMEEFELMNDSKYRMYVAAVDKALKNFEYTAEWADLISALGKLNKVLLSYIKFPVIPRRIKIGKRLAQCMHPALPSGVHLKALETYDIIFRCMGTNRLACELFIYSSGLFPLMSHAAMNIRPTLLTIYETHFVPLGDRLRPALSGFLSGILPGLDTGTDHFDRTNKLLEDVCEGVDPPYFYTCIWQCVANNSPVRLPAVTYVYAHYSRKLPMEDQLYLMGHDIGLMVSGLCAAVQDSSVLVQRSALDLLMVCFPMQNKQLLYADMVRLVTAALSTILRRDMSLNRRLYSWLLEADTSKPLVQIDGHEEEEEDTSSSPHSIAYDLLNDAIKNILKKSSTVVPIDIKSYRLLTSLFEKPQIGPVILDGVLYDVFRTLYLSCLNSQKHKSHPVRCVSFNGDLKSLNGEVTLNKQFVQKNCQELVKNANLLFNTLQSYYIWSYIERLYEDACKHTNNSLRDRNQVCDIGSGPPHVLELCILTDFLLDIIPIETYAESTSNILPNLFISIVTNLCKSLRDFNKSEIEQSLELCQKILGKIQPISLKIDEPEDEESEEPTIEKSKSDSRISETLNSSDELRDRTYSNPFLKKRSPKNKSKNKKSKSSSKLYDVKSDVTEESSSKESSPPAQPPVTKYENKNLLRCLNAYKTFYLNLLTVKVLPHSSIPQTIQSLTCDRELRLKQLKLLLDQRLLEGAKRFHPVKLEQQTLPQQKQTNNPFSGPYDQSMKLASNLLLEFCGFPNLVTSEEALPDWLQALLVCCTEASMEVQLCAITTLLEVFSLAKTQQVEGERSVVIGGILDLRHVIYVEENTLIIEEISRILWTFLIHIQDQKQLMTCVTLLYQIHNTFDSKLFVEHVIARFLSRDHVTANHVKQFCVLWHLGRDLMIKLPAHKCSVRSFDRSLLKILDLLHQSDKPTLQLLSQNFLSHSLLHHDIPRILNPLLVRLLSANTARVSIRHVNINGELHEFSDVEEPQEKNGEKKIYAVSNVNGNVIYHSDSPKLKSPKKRWFGGRTGKKYGSVIDMTSSLMEDSNQVVTKKNKDFKNYNSSLLGNLIINPLNKEIYPNGIDGSYAKLSMDSSDSEEEPPKRATLPKSRSFEQPKPEESALVQSWSYCISDNHLPGEFEISKSAEDFFNKNLEIGIVQDILNEIIDNVCRNFERKQHSFTLYPIHSHLCLYYEVFDLNQVIYSLQILQNCLQSNPLLFIKCCATKGVKDLAGNDVINLLARHRKSLQGQGFYGDLSQEFVNLYRGYMFLDVILSVCVNYARTFFPSFEDLHISEEIGLNLRIQLQSLEILHLIIDTLVKMTDNKGFKSYIADLLVKCKLQKTLLHCLLTSVRTFDVEMTFAEDILLYNHFQNTETHLGEHVESFQTLLLKLVHSLIILEHEVFPKSQNSSSSETVPSGGEHLNYTPTVLIPKQQIFLSAILSALRHKGMRGMHEKWLNMVTTCLPYLGDNLKQISISVIFQICNNIEDLAVSYTKTELEDCELCSDYTISQLESLTILCHYCLLDASQNQNVPTPTTPSTTNPGEIFNNLVNVFFSPLSQDIHFGTKQNSDYYQSARKTILSHMPRIISSVAKLWQIVVGLETDYTSIYGNAKTVKQQLLEFLSPIAVHHGASFLSAIAVAWFERRNPFTSVKAVLPEPNGGQNNLVDLIGAIRVIPLDNLVQTVTAVMKNPPPCEGLSLDICLEVAVLELFYCYMRKASPTQLSEAWTSLLTLIREVASLSPPAQFLLAAILHEMMIKCCPLEERKDQKDLQDVTAKLIDCVSQVCGSCLEQTTWLRKNLAVKEEEESTPDTSTTSLDCSATCSVQAQLVLSEILAPILDISFGSSEKDKINSILTSLMSNIVPYLRTHTTKNMPSFHACSKLLSSLSSYQYTRKAWKKDVFDLLLDNSLFQMDLSSLKFWKAIVDNLMTHDNTTFRDLMSRVSMTQSGTLGIFSSREQEYEQKGQLLKRLAYVIFCSEIDQYAKYMPDIQEQLTTSLRINVPGIQAQVFMCFRVILIRMSPLQVTSLWPIIISEMLQVFLQIEQELSTDSEEFSSHIRLMTSLDASWATNSSNGLHALGHPHWLRLQLATAKLLDLALLLPATTLPQFQMYRWAFVGDDLRESTNQIAFTPHVIRVAQLMDRKYPESQIDILPMKRNELLLSMNTIVSLKELHSFFKTLSSCSNRHRSECSKSVASDNLFSDRQNDKQLDLILDRIDRVVEADFLDKIPR